MFILSESKILKANGSYIKKIVRVEKHDLLILDDSGIQPFDNQNRHSLMEMI
jgi:DNA replication protein DnaC